MRRCQLHAEVVGVRASRWCAYTKYVIGQLQSVKMHNMKSPMAVLESGGMRDELIAAQFVGLEPGREKRQRALPWKRSAWLSYRQLPAAFPSQ